MPTVTHSRPRIRKGAGGYMDATERLNRTRGQLWPAVRRRGALPLSFASELFNPEAFFLELGALHFGFHPPRSSTTTRPNLVRVFLATELRGDLSEFPLLTR